MQGVFFFHSTGHTIISHPFNPLIFNDLQQLCKRPSFTLQYAVFYKPKDDVLQHER